MRSGMAVVVGALLMSGSAWADDAAEHTYNSKCASCHGKDGKGQTPMGRKTQVKDLSDAQVQANLKDDDLLKWIVDGNEAQKMPGYKGKLTDDEIKAVAAYTRSLKK